MKKTLLIVDGGPRRNMNTAALCDAFEEGARAASPDIDVARVRLYDLPPFRGCVSCLACKLKGRETGLCAVRDSLADTLRAVNEADGFVLASPIYFSEWTAVARAFLERLVFPWLRYTDFSCAAPKKMPLAWIYTMNAPKSMMPGIRQHLSILEGAVARALGDPEPQFVEAHSTVQVKDYSRYAMDGLDPAAHLAWREAHWDADLAAARAAGRAMAEKALAAKR
ncbi:MAG: flavodoxin family protein [Kiritimatiellae bacterium]|nr:flavodoxin family protein [Kiritimatiellia bacterium]